MNCQMEEIRKVRYVGRGLKLLCSPGPPLSPQLYLVTDREGLQSPKPSLLDFYGGFVTQA